MPKYRISNSQDTESQKDSGAEVKSRISIGDFINISTNDFIKIIFSVGSLVVLLKIINPVLQILSESDISVESIISVLLAFFSIFISLFFYFKANETSNKFYDSSYSFMKEESKLLGQIQVLFGEKFDNLTKSVDRLDYKKTSKEQEITVVRDQTEKILSSIVSELNKETIDKNEIERYKARLKESNARYNELNSELSRLKSESLDLKSLIERNNPNYWETETLYNFLWELKPKDIDYILRNKKLQKSSNAFKVSMKYGMCDEKGNLSEFARLAVEDKKSREY
ncbi:MAG: hypothetical protein VB047_06865 [Anaerotignum propionicum]|uniref:hypothetical protein n=1 Tax=Anaerotignum propionicum TaxID=28446 RepID=UPI002B20FE62|nr:hypothetical protein [Anaerotignum propionicum]MEA5057263.1 hypothetical protein [Anaerotignum propionicum]